MDGPTDAQTGLKNVQRLAIMNQRVQNASMARPLEFDRPLVVNRALALFWRKGYQAGSLAELLAAMGIGRSSFYAAFADKRSLYIECMDLFAARTLELLRHARSEKPPVDALQSFFERNFSGARGVKGRWGCMLVNTVLEMAGVDDELAARASRHLDEMQDLFQSCLEEAGAVPARAAELAAMLMLFNEGIRVSSRRRLPDARHEEPIATVFNLIRSAIA
ncbi:MAG: TetR/AcrR family transcriptional regulator [Burkholderiales bacterium]